MSDRNAETDRSKSKAKEPVELTDEVARCPGCGSRDTDSEEELSSTEDVYNELFRCTACGRWFVVHWSFSFYVESAWSYRAVECPRCKKMGAVFVGGHLVCDRCDYDEREHTRRHGNMPSQDPA